MEVTFQDIYKKLSDIDVRKDKLVKTKEVGKKEYYYVPWAIAWAKIVAIYPNSTYKTLCGEKGFPCFFHDQLGGFCKTEVEIEGFVRTMELPVLDFNNKAMKAESYTYTTKFSGEKTVNAINRLKLILQINDAW